MRINLSRVCLLFGLCFLWLFSAQANEKQLKIALRTIGHQFLMEQGDSTSRILPIEKVGKRYAMAFEKEFAFPPEALTSLVYKVMEERKLKHHFIVEVEEYTSQKVQHSFEANLLYDQSNIACKARTLPKACYIFYFTVLPQKEATNHSKVSEAQNENSKAIYLLLPLLLAGGIGVYWARNKFAATTEQLRIGKFRFDQKGMKLELDAQSIELSAKEADLLLLLYQNESKTLERAYILNQVWGDEGDYVGRTLDVFISKLRKKIAADPNLKIINVRGVGYRFVMST